MKSFRLVQFAALFVALALTACGGGGGGSSSSAVVPVPVPVSSDWSKLGTPVWEGFVVAGDPSVVQEAGTYRLYYTAFIPSDGVSQERASIAVAVSGDGVAWSYAPLAPVATDNPETIALDGDPNGWDSALETAEVIKVGNEYLMYYSGYRPGNNTVHEGAVISHAEIGLARSTDGLTFTRQRTTPVLTRTPDGDDATAMFSPTVILSNGVYYMIYTGWCVESTCGNRTGFRLLGATSSDGVNWTKRSVPVLDGVDLGLSFAAGVGESALVEGPDGLFYLFYSATGANPGDPNTIGVVRSSTPFGPWEVKTIPIIFPTEPFEGQETIAPAVLVEGDRARMWYMGVVGDFVDFSIGLAEADWPLSW